MQTRSETGTNLLLVSCVLLEDMNRVSHGVAAEPSAYIRHTNTAALRRRRVGNTDAEGRMVMADLLCLVSDVTAASVV